MAVKSKVKKKAAVSVKKTAKKKAVKKTKSTPVVKKEKKEKKKSGKSVKKETSQVLINSVIKGMQEKKAKDIRWLNLKKIPNCSFDHFIICHADNKIQVNAISESIEEMVEKECGIRPSHIEGRENAEWIILDYLDVVAHVFLGEMRYHYNLEGFWGDAETKDIS